MNCRRFAVPLAVAALVLATSAHAATQTRTLKPSYVSPQDLCGMLGVTEAAGVSVLHWSEDGADHLVTFRRNDAANLVVIEGEPADLDHVAAQAAQFDVPPRQIALEARIVEIDTDRARDLGIDWSRIYTNVSADFSRVATGRAMTNSSSSIPSGIEFGTRSELHDRTQTDSERASASLSNALSLLEQQGAATYRDTPRILTLNNRTATILDGERTTYVTRYSAYNDLFETQTMDSGLRLEVTPSLGESGYLRLDLQAELTSLSGSISGSPVKRGQIVENTVMAHDGEPVVLGGFTRTTDEKTHREFPVLGRILPFLFSREIVTQRHHESLVVITPHVVDLAAKLDPHEQEMLQGR